MVVVVGAVAAVMEKKNEACFLYPLTLGKNVHGVYLVVRSTLRCGGGERGKRWAGRGGRGWPR